MKLIATYAEITPLIRPFLTRGVYTNNFLTEADYRREIAGGNLWAHAWRDGLLFFRRRPELNHLTFYLKALTAPEVEYPPATVCEVVLPKNAAGYQAVVEFWQGQGMETMLKLHCLQRPADTLYAPGAFAGAVRQGTAADLASVAALLSAAFDRYSGGLPPAEELRAELAAGRVLCAETAAQTLAGVLRWCGAGAVSEIRHLAVDRSCRRQGAAAALITAYFTLTAAKTYRLWTGQDNVASNQLYRQYGFTPNGMTSVMLKK